MQQINEKIHKLLELLEIEENDEIEIYQEKVLNQSLNDRKDKGITWYPIVINQSELLTNENLNIEIEKTNNLDKYHSFRKGSVVSIFSNQDKGKDNPNIIGVVSKVKKNILKISIYNDELPNWTKDGKLGLDLYYDHKSYKEAKIALNKVLFPRESLERLTKVILGIEPAKINNSQQNLEKTINLNYKQNEAIEKILRSKDIALIHGPPGTGKTTTLVNAIKLTLKNESQLLACAASNTAVDLLTEKMFEKDIKVLRIGNPIRISDKLTENSIDYKLTNHTNYQYLEKLLKDANKIKKEATKFKKTFGYAERQDRKEKLLEVKNIMKQARNMEKDILDSIISESEVITCTLVGSANEVIRDKIFSTVFIDESSQALEPMSWIPITRAERVIFAGDHKQLPPTVKSKEAEKLGLGISLFEKCIKNQPESSIMLETQYRMNEKIMDFSSLEFYEGNLEAHESVKNNLLDKNSDKELLNTPVEFIDTAGCGYDEKRNEISLSYSNIEEANLLFKHLNLLLNINKNDNTTIGIITPYKEQELTLKNLKENDCNLKNNQNISIGSIDSFQGQERDIIYISLVRSNENNEIGFLQDTRRMNVAITRAKKKLIVIGDSSTLGNNKFYSNFIEYIESIEAYKSAWDYMYLD